MKNKWMIVEIKPEMVSPCSMASSEKFRAQKTHVPTMHTKKEKQKRSLEQIAAQVFRIIQFGHKFSPMSTTGARQPTCYCITLTGKIQRERDRDKETERDRESENKRKVNTENTENTEATYPRTR